MTTISLSGGSAIVPDFSQSSITPTMPITGHGLMALPSVSLYNDTFPETTGVDNWMHASLMPATHSTSCAIISGFSGFPKLRLLVTARGVAPTAIILRYASATACLPPT